MQIGRLEIFTSLTPIRSLVYLFDGICILLIILRVINVMIFLDISPFFPYSFFLNSYLIIAEKYENDTLLKNMLFVQIAICLEKKEISRFCLVTATYTGCYNFFLDVFLVIKQL